MDGPPPTISPNKTNTTTPPSTRLHDNTTRVNTTRVNTTRELFLGPLQNARLVALQKDLGETSDASLVRLLLKEVRVPEAWKTVSKDTLLAML